MKIFVGERGAGNTTVLVQQASKFGYPIICPYYANKEYLTKLAKKLDIICPLIFTYNEIKNGCLKGHNFDAICVSDFDWILSDFLKENGFNGRIDCISASLD